MLDQISHSLINAVLARLPRAVIIPDCPDEIIAKLEQGLKPIHNPRQKPPEELTEEEKQLLKEFQIQLPKSKVSKEQRKKLSKAMTGNKNAKKKY